MRKHLLIFLAVLLLALTAMSAGAETVVDTGTHLYCAAGTTRPAFYPDLSAKIGTGLTQSDFVITYSTTSEYVTLDAKGNASISADAPLYNNLPVFITYTPKVEGVGVTTTFKVILRTNKNINSFTATPTEAYLGSGGAVSVEIDGVSDYFDEIVGITYDTSMLKMTTKDGISWDERIDAYIFTAKKPGKTKVTFYAFNGMKAVVNVNILENPTKFEFGADSFVCNVGDTLDLGIDLGNGPDGMKAASPSVTLTKDGKSVSSWVNYLIDRRSKFAALETGYYTLKMTLGEWSDTTKIAVYDDVNCTSIRISSGELYQGRDGMQVICTDAAGNSILRPTSITEGGDIARLNGRYITVTGAGTVTITARNPDGTTVSQRFEVRQNPTAMYLDVYDLPMEIGEDHTLQVSFDQGSYPHTYSIDYAEFTPKYGLHCIRMEGDRIIAQAPGTAKITVTAGEFSAVCKVTVADGDKALTFITPPAPFGIGHTATLDVQDKTGRSYPAVYTSEYDHRIDLRQDGQIIGLLSGSEEVTATLADGRVLKTRVYVEKVPNEIYCEDVSITIESDSFAFDRPDSDVGELDRDEYTVTVEDPSIVRYRTTYFDVLSVGVTRVTVKSIYNDVSTTFLVEVLPKSTLLVGSTSVDVPYGFSVAMPEVRDNKGNVVKMTWKITHQEPGTDNPEDTGFTMDGDVITCTWPTASCIVTGTATKTKETIKIVVNGYLLPTELAIEPEQVWLEVGELQKVSLTTSQDGTSIKLVGWAAEPAGIITYNQLTEGRTNTVMGKAAGTAVLAAVLDNGAYAMCLVNVYEPEVRLPGDVNEDGVVNAKDALRVMQYDAGWDVIINGWQGDVNADGHTDLSDAVLIFQYASGLDVQLKKYIPES